MIRLLLLFSLLVSMFTISSMSASAQAVCGDVEAYFAEIDELVFEEMKVLFQDPEWVQGMERGTRKANASEMSILALDEDELAPFIDILSLMSDVLLDYPEEEIPELVLPFHESAMSYWIDMPAMLKAIGQGGPFAAMLFVDSMEKYEWENYQAQLMLQDECPDLFEELTQAADDDEVSQQLAEPGSEEFDISDIEEAPKGLAFGMMSVADLDDPPARPESD